MRPSVVRRAMHHINLNSYKCLGQRPVFLATIFPGYQIALTFVFSGYYGKDSSVQLLVKYAEIGGTYLTLLPSTYSRNPQGTRDMRNSEFVMTYM